MRVARQKMQRSFSSTGSLLDLCGVYQRRCVRGWRVKRWFRKDRTNEYFCEFGHPATLQTSHDEYHRDAVVRVARYRTHAELLLAFWASMGFKPGDLMTVGMNQKRAA